MTSECFARSGRPPTPEGTPAEIADNVAWEPREPVPLGQSDVGVHLDPVDLGDPFAHRLVVLGDSISHGFKSFAIADTHLAWPKLVADAAGFEFRVSSYPGPKKCQGMPLNLEAVVRELEPHMPGSLIDIFEDVDVLHRLRGLMDDVEDYWERKEGADLVTDARGQPVNHNLAIWGWDVRDTMDRTVGHLTRSITGGKHRRDNVLTQITSAAGERSALLALTGGLPNDTPVTLAQRLGSDPGGIETLVVALGANNILGTVLDFEVKWSQNATYQDLERKGAANAWLPSHFANEYDTLVSKIRAINAKHVIFLTVPHVTIVPMVRGIGNKMPGDRYFARYTRPWITDDVFSPNRHPCLTGNELRAIDWAIDQYNNHIVNIVRSERLDQALKVPGAPRTDWRVVDLAGLLDRLAYRRYLLDEEARPDWWTPYVLPAAYQELSPQPDSRFYVSDRFGRNQGGLFALDGVHPTTIGYGIIAKEVMHAMAEAGVAMANAEPDFHKLLDKDTLISKPPMRISSVLRFVELADRSADLYQALRHRAPV